MAQTLNFNDKHYDIESLSEDAKAQVNNIRYAEAKIAELQREAALFQTARAAFTNALGAALKDVPEVEAPEEDAG